MITFSAPKTIDIVGFPMSVTAINHQGKVIGAIYSSNEADVPRPFNVIVKGKDRGFFASIEDAQRVAKGCML